MNLWYTYRYFLLASISMEAIAKRTVENGQKANESPRRKSVCRRKWAHEGCQVYMQWHVKTAHALRLVNEMERASCMWRFYFQSSRNKHDDNGKDEGKNTHNNNIEEEDKRQDTPYVYVVAWRRTAADSALKHMNYSWEKRKLFPNLYKFTPCWWCVWCL